MSKPLKLGNWFKKSIKKLDYDGTESFYMYVS